MKKLLDRLVIWLGILLLAASAIIVFHTLRMYAGLEQTPEFADRIINYIVRQL